MKKRVFYIIMSVLLLLIIAGFVVLTKINSYKIEKNFDKTVIGELAENKDSDDYAIQMTISDSWHEGDGSIGAQYDGLVFNNTEFDCNDWVIKIKVPVGSYIDSSWDGVFDLKDNVITIKPMDYNGTIFAKDSRKFGMILYTKGNMSDVSITLEGKVVFKYNKSSYFYALIILAFIWVAVMVGYFITEAKVSYYKKRGERDHKIITESIITFINFIDAKDQYTKGHSRRVAMYAKKIGKKLNLSEEELENLYYIALMHDAGKVGTPDAILNKKGPLTPEERGVIKNHTILGADMLKNFTSIEGIKEGALYHHERYDGLGYPNGIKGEEIPLNARIIGLADSYDAMSSDRCYRKKLSKETILQELKNNSGTQFDPNLVKYVISMIEDDSILLDNDMNIY